MADPQPDQPVNQDPSAPTNGQPSTPAESHSTPSAPAQTLTDIDPILGPSQDQPQPTQPAEELKTWPAAAGSSDSSTPASTTKPLWRRLWLVWVSIVVVAVLAVIFWFVYSSFNDNIAADHAEHQQQTPSVHQIVHVRQKLMVGLENTFEPMEFLDPQTNQLVGFDVDLSKAIAKELNVPVEFTQIDFDSIFAQANLGSSNVLTKGEVDMVIDSVSITDLRKQYYSFSNPYLNAGQIAIVLNTNTTIKTGDDLKNKKITVASSTTNETLALTYTTTDKVIRYTEPEQQANAVITGKADAMLVDLTNAKGIVDNHPQLKIATDPLTSDYYGIVMDKNKADLVEHINQILDSLKQRGVLESLKQKWLE